MMFAMMMAVAIAQQPPPKKDFVGPPDPEGVQGPDIPTVRRRIEQNMRLVEERLRKQDANRVTQGVQKDIVSDFELLLKMMRNPQDHQDRSEPPPPKDLPQPPGDTSDNSNQEVTSTSSGPGGGRTKEEMTPSARSQAGGSRRERKGSRQQSPESVRSGNKDETGGGQSAKSDDLKNDRGTKRGDQTGNPGGNPDQGTGATMPNEKTGKPEKLSEMSRDVWGHLPESLRQEVDHYYHERFMPKYRELLRQYYSRLAEADRKSEPKK